MTTPRATPSSRASARVDGSGALVAQRARADALAQLVLELRAQPDRGVAVEAHHQVDAGTGLHLRVPTGPRQ